MLRMVGAVTVVVALGVSNANAAPGDTTLVGRDASGQPTSATAYAVSDDGRHVVYYGSTGPVVHDLVTGTRTPPGGPERDTMTDAAISADGSVIAIESTYSNYNAPASERPEKTVGVYAGAPGRLEQINYRPDGTCCVAPSGQPDISSDGRFVSWVTDEDPGGGGRVFIRDRRQGRTIAVSHPNGETTNDRICFGAKVSATGRFVSYLCIDVIDGRRQPTGGVYVRDVEASTTTLACAQDEATSCGDWAPAVSSDGRIVTWSGRTGVFVRDMVAGQTDRVAPAGLKSDVSDDGRYVVYAYYGIKVLDRATGNVEVANRADGADGREAPSDFYWGGMTGNGRFVLFQSADDTLDAQSPAPVDGSERAYLRELVRGAPQPASPSAATPAPSATLPALPSAPAPAPRHAATSTVTRRAGLTLRITPDARLRSHGLRITITNSRRRTARGSVLVRSGRRTIGRRALRLRPGRTITVRVKLRRIPRRATVALRVGHTVVSRAVRLR